MSKDFRGASFADISALEHYLLPLYVHVTVKCEMGNRKSLLGVPQSIAGISVNFTVLEE